MVKELRLDDDTFRRFQRGDHDAFTKVYETYHGLMYTIIYSIVRHRENAEDVLQDTAIKMFHKAHTCRSKETLQAWLALIARNTALNAIAKKTEQSWQDAFDHYVQTEDEDGMFSTWHQQLTDKENLILAYHLVYGLGFELIGKILNHATSHVYKIYHDALEKIKEDYR